MKFEKIKIINKNKIIIGGLIGLGVISAINILPSFAKYKLTESINIVNGTINYKVPDLKVMAIYQQNDAGTYEEVKMMPESGYVINEEKTYCTTDNVNQIKGKAYTNSSGELVFKNLTKSDKCYLYFDKKLVANTILAGITVNENNPDFSKIADTNEGVFKVSDGMYGGYSYYFRGAVTNNYVKFANFCWRIVRINGDGSIRLIYDGTTCHANGTSTVESVAVANQAYNASADRSEYVGYTYTEGSQRPSSTTSGTASNLKTQMENWYKKNISDKGFDEQVVLGKFCNDRSIANGYSWSSKGKFDYAAKERLETNKTPTLNCTVSNDVYNLKVGAITADEVSFAGGVVETANNSYYLYNGQPCFTMTPYCGNISNYSAYIFFTWGGGQIIENFLHGVFGVRPVINLNADVSFSSGNGTLDTPYIVAD